MAIVALCHGEDRERDEEKEISSLRVLLGKDLLLGLVFFVLGILKSQ